MNRSLYEDIPQVSKIIEDPDFKSKYTQFNPEIVSQLVRKAIDTVRRDIAEGRITSGVTEAISKTVAKTMNILLESSLKPVVNATGILLHTNLGRAPMAENARLNSILSQYSNLEFDLSVGKRGKRGSHVAKLISIVTGAEAGVLVNNNAAGVLLTLKVLAEGKEVIVSRGELIELGGSFRIPDIMRQSGAILREVGTTNRTHLKDYESAINEKTAMILKVHPSNYAIRGFSKSPSTHELADLAHRNNLPMVYDIGSGLLKPLNHKNFKDEPSCRESIDDGADLVTFSGDKLLGGTQAGFIVGKDKLTSRIKKNPLMRTYRLSKAHICMIEETLRLWLLPDSEVILRNPVMRLITISDDELKEHAEKLFELIKDIAEPFKPGIISTTGQMGGGSLPDIDFNSWGIELTPVGSAQSLLADLRSAKIPVISHIEDDKVILDVRTILPGQDQIVADSIKYAVQKQS